MAKKKNGKLKKISEFTSPPFGFVSYFLLFALWPRDD